MNDGQLSAVTPALIGKPIRTTSKQIVCGAKPTNADGAKTLLNTVASIVAQTPVWISFWAIRISNWRGWYLE
jgi:hypothetical protein